MEKPEPDRVTTDTVNAGVYVLDRSVVTAIPTGRAVSIEREFFPGLLRDRVPFFGWVSESYWLDIGSPAKYRQGQLDLLAGKVATDAGPAGRRPGAALRSPPGAHVAPDARSPAPVRDRARLAPRGGGPGGPERGARGELRGRSRERTSRAPSSGTT